MTPARRSLAEIEADLARLDAEMRPYGDFDNTPKELQDRLVDLTDDLTLALNASSAEDHNE